MDDSQELVSIDIELNLSIIKQLHAKWMIEVYNEMTSAEGKDVCLKRWKVSDIKGAVELGVTKLPNLDPFDNIDSMLEEDCNNILVTDSSAILRAVLYIPSDHEIGRGNHDDHEEWIDEQSACEKFCMKQAVILNFWVIFEKLMSFYPKKIAKKPFKSLLFAAISDM